MFINWDSSTPEGRAAMQRRRLEEEALIREAVINSFRVGSSQSAAVMGGSVVFNLRLRFSEIIYAEYLVGDATNVDDWNDYFDLPQYGNPFTSVTIEEDTVILRGGSNIETKAELFSDYPYLLEVDDDGAIVTLGSATFGGFSEISSLERISCPNATRTKYESGLAGVFEGCLNLVYANLPRLIYMEGAEFYDCLALTDGNLILAFGQITSLGEYAFGYSALTQFNFPNLISIGYNCFSDCYYVPAFNFPKLEIAGDWCFGGCDGTTIFDFPNLKTVGEYCFAGCNAMLVCNLPSCTELGPTVGGDNVFGVGGNEITLTIPAALMTCNSDPVPESPDGDIQYLQEYNPDLTIITV